MNSRCPVCDSYSCRCSASRLRGYLDDHRFDHSSNVLRRWAQDDACKNVEGELRDRRRKEREEEERRLERRREQERLERQQEDEYYRRTAIPSADVIEVLEE